MRLTDVQHQARAVSILRRSLASGRMAHAYLFEGPEGVGKELTARAMAARLLCAAPSLGPADDACGACTGCRLLATDNHPDYHLIHRGLHKLHPTPTIRNSKGLYLVVDVVRHFLIDPAGLKPTQGPRRVFVIRDAERMNEEAQNALLKTLEEPPGNATLLLVTSSAARLLPTIRSRCQRVQFDLLPRAFVAETLQARTDLAAADALALANLSEGRLGVALAWQRGGLLALLPPAGEQITALGGGDVEAFGKGLVDMGAALALGMRAADEDEGEGEAGAGKGSGGKSVATDELRGGLKLVLMLVAALYREALLLASGTPQLCYLAEARARAERLAETHATDQLEARIQAVANAERMLDRNVAPQLVCERLGVALTGEAPVVR